GLGGGVGAGGVTAQPATRAHASTSTNQDAFAGILMAWILLESLVALIVLVFIVWWTMRPSRLRDRATRAGAAKRDDQS
ncbi:MAG TPA: hypothetical protein VFC24_14800, partial [Casimicrobiaceae bacterium]|nr:hypothetical protein [Casimicrobiaceae bacterium]